jgi:hypothetical protein
MLGIISAALFLVNGIAFAQTPVLDAADCPAFLGTLNGCQGGLRGIVLAIINFALGFLGLLAVIMVIYGGFLYVSSAGNEENVNKAKKILLYAVLGIVVILVSFALVNTILGAASGERAA